MEKSMSSDFKIVEEATAPRTMNPKKFAMWLFIATVFMLFAALTSAYIVRQAEGNWVYFELPNLFTVSTVVILLSSVSMQWAYWSAKKDNLDEVKWLVIITSLLGLAFLVLQVMGWSQMVDMKVYFVGNPSGSFVYALTLVHGVHLISAIVFLAILLISTLRFRVHSKNMVQIEMCATYWHFLGGLWLYLFVFLILYR